MKFQEKDLIDMLSGVKTSQEISEVGRRMRTFSLGIAGSRLDKELEMFFPGAPLLPANGTLLPWFLCIKEITNTYTPQKKGMQSVHRAGISEINLSIGAGLNLQYEEIIFEFYSSICMILPPPP